MKKCAPNMPLSTLLRTGRNLLEVFGTKQVRLHEDLCMCVGELHLLVQFATRPWGVHKQPDFGSPTKLLSQKRRQQQKMVVYVCVCVVCVNVCMWGCGGKNNGSRWGKKTKNYIHRGKSSHSYKTRTTHSIQHMQYTTQTNIPCIRIKSPGR